MCIRDRFQDTVKGGKYCEVVRKA